MMVEGKDRGRSSIVICHKKFSLLPVFTSHQTQHRLLPRNPPQIGQKLGKNERIRLNPQNPEIALRVIQDLSPVMPAHVNYSPGMVKEGV